MTVMLSKKLKAEAKRLGIKPKTKYTRTKILQAQEKERLTKV